MTMRLLDLFCCAGGATRGYQRAGFHVTGVDIRQQPNYCGDEFVQDDAIAFLRGHGHKFDAIHASPPCQGYSLHVTSASSGTAGTKGRDEPRLATDVRALLRRSGRPWVMENVMGARRDLRASLLLCGTMFGLPIPRHRLFESSELIMSPEHPSCRGVALAYARERGWDPRDMTVTGKGRRAGTTQRWQEVMGIDWHTTQHELREAIPPAYTEYIGRRLMAAIHPSEEAARAAA